ncbi:MAG TPA: uracil-DNA glycosylase [Chitinophagales bacterium]|jgi:uracil-DNA glycosylase|nr:uracil-DNA glycosylase [Chitinophagales bacterium]
MANLEVQIENSWKQILTEQFEQPYFLELQQFLQLEKNQGKIIYPPSAFVFNAFNSSPFNKVRVVILGQDPYHGIGQAHGLCFSVPSEIKKLPPSLKNIYKELQNDVGFKIPNHGNLQKWTTQGVFLLNAILTVEANTPASHQKRGWEQFTNAVIKKLSEQREGLIFLLWGNFAQQKTTLIDTQKHIILKAPHPSPFSAHSGFFGCKHFSQVNDILRSKGELPIDWQV